MPERDHDIVIFGATGFTGELTAAYLAAHAPDGLRWALAGRNPAKLEEVRTRLARIDPALADLPLLHADSTDDASLRAVAESARVVVSTVGPYLLYGEPLVAACAAAGTDYLDLTGETEFVDRMYLEHHDAAVASGARLVHACGFDSIPHDLGVLFTVKQLPDDVPLTIRGSVRSNATASGGTFASALTAFSRGRQMKKASAERRAVEPRPQGRKVRTVAKAPHKDPVLGTWVVPLPTIDPFVVKRSAAARADYGPEFSYAHYAGVKTLRYVVGGVTGVGLLAAAAQVGPVRRALLSRLPAGTGPDEARRERSWFTVDFVGEGGGRRVRTRVSGGDPGYTETAKMLAESALCLAFDDNPESAGSVTTSVAMGENLMDRIVKAGISFDVTGSEDL